MPSSEPQQASCWCASPAGGFPRAHFAAHQQPSSLALQQLQRLLRPPDCQSVATCQAPATLLLPILFFFFLCAASLLPSSLLPFRWPLRPALLTRPALLAVAPPASKLPCHWQQRAHTFFALRHAVTLPAACSPLLSRSLRPCLCLLQPLLRRMKEDAALKKAQRAHQRSWVLCNGFGWNWRHVVGWLHKTPRERALGVAVIRPATQACGAPIGTRRGC